MSLDLLDPTRPDDPRFDPAGEQAARVRAAALTRRPAPRPAGRRLVLAGAVAAIAAALLVVVVVRSPTDARAALEAAAARTAAIESGRVVWTIRSDPPGPVWVVGRAEIRFQGGDLAYVSSGEIVLEDGRRERTGSAYREIGDDAYARDDTKPGARFERMPPTSEEDQPHKLVANVGSQGLIALARRADDLTTDGTTYRATTTAGEVFDAAPTAAGRFQGGAWDRPVTLEVVVGPDGLVRRVSVTDDHGTETTEYLDLGEPQVIERPPTR
jgi:hypothetical protein